MSDVHDGRTHSLNPLTLPFTRIVAMFVRMHASVCVCVCVFGCAVAISPDSRTRIRGHVAIMFAAMSSGREVGCTVRCDAMRCSASSCTAHSAIDSHVAPEAIIKFIAWKWAKLRGRVERQTGKLTNRQTDKLPVYLSACLAPPFLQKSSKWVEIMRWIVQMKLGIITEHLVPNNWWEVKWIMAPNEVVKLVH